MLRLRLFWSLAGVKRPIALSAGAFQTPDLLNAQIAGKTALLKVPAQSQ